MMNDENGCRDDVKYMYSMCDVEGNKSNGAELCCVQDNKSNGAVLCCVLDNKSNGAVLCCVVYKVSFKYFL